MSAGATEGAGRSPDHLLYSVAVEYYLQEATQAEIAQRLRTSRATVSRLLAEARRRGIVSIEVRHPDAGPDRDLAAAVADALGLHEVHLYPDVPADSPHGVLSGALSRPLAAVLEGARLAAGDVLLVSSGRMVYAAAHAELPQLPGVLVAPTVGGQLEPEPWYQTNEIIRAFAASVGGNPAFLYAPALPGAALREGLLDDPGIRRVVDTWGTAKAAVMGIGAPPQQRVSLPHFVPAQSAALDRAVGDICSRFYDREGVAVEFPGSERLIATPLELLQRIPVTVAVASGPEKVGGILAGARAGYFNRLVTDTSTAAQLVSATS
ncbi:sugar-binding domain-containing protein [Quadrisphaera sp. INWT6]|uniref:sugar-binding transcriptional regulator n=1 Tax=Quadrisphaera sp. INWT6 TaxID=2596917 RepID=UPI002814F19D|nr:sugar-binding domain-containing protein [Quadrisphaera sp. INWT6]